MADNKPQGQTEFTAKENAWLTVKYFLIAASAGAIQLGSFTLLTELVFKDADNEYGWSYFISLVLSVIWNFTINRRYTFKSAANVPRAMALVFAYYLVFTPLSIWWGTALTNRFDVHWVIYATEIGTMLVNGVTEYLYQRLVIYRGTINTNELAQNGGDAEK
ncbi:MAG: GtrA family protein [Oscillospiraceae bacterium]|jgi:putative flippase GtrA|nr:GtrA family protein [Oscillospiraceae bacterium]